MKKKLEAELISIAHRILKLKNRSEIDQLQQETLRLYEKLSVLRFVEDNFSDVKPTIGYASAEEKLEEIYGIEETEPVHANEVEAEEEKAKAEKTAKGFKDKGKSGETAQREDKKDESEDKEEPSEKAKPEGDADPGQKVEEYQASEEEKEQTEDKGGEKGTESEPTESKDSEKEGDSKEEEPEHKIEVVKTEEEIKAMEEGAAAVFDKGEASTPEEEERAADAEVITIEPEKNAGTQGQPTLDFEEKPAEHQKPKEITFEDFHDYKEPEFVKKSDISEPTGINKEFLPKEPEVIAKQEEKAETMWEEPKQEEKKEEELQAKPVRDWRDWEPSTSPYASKPKEEPKEEPKRSLNDIAGKTISLGLNDRIAFEKHLFGGSSEDLNRVLSQLNTLDTFSEARNFIDDLVKPDYNNWKNKEEYEERFMAIVEKRFE